MPLAKVRITMQDLDDKSGWKYVYYGIYCSEKDEVVIPYTTRESLENAIKKAGGSEIEAMERIFVNEGIGYFNR